MDTNIYSQLSISMNSETLQMLDWLCEQDQNNRSQKIRVLIRKEYKARRHGASSGADGEKKDGDVLNGSQVGI
ncbi:MAG TPA: hypothetical protein PKW33_21705 [Anaerolineaceae bacterium]|nr:hypothetical protein [Anaerolineaceae bacterium]HPN54225.1 hypothetical protein [Anaerolineaceae bacterium]